MSSGAGPAAGLCLAVLLGFPIQAPSSDAASLERLNEPSSPAATRLVTVAAVPSRFIIRIMPLGDSITEASSGFGSYRYYLWQELAREGFTVDFVGSMTGTGSEASTSAEFDSDHEGHPGWRADEVAARVEDWAVMAQPDLVLIHLGTNDLAQGQSPSDVIQDLRTIIDRLRIANPRVHILLAQIIPMGADGPADVLELNKAIPILADRIRTADSPVEPVDHFTGFDHAGMTWDGIHPNRDGNRRMAAIWRRALLPHLRAIQQAAR